MNKPIKQYIVYAVGFLFIGFWFVALYLLKGYVNNFVPGVHADGVRLKSLDCVHLIGIHVDRPTVKGFFVEATACRKGKTIDINGGNVQVALSEGKGQEGSEGFAVTARNLTVQVKKEPWSVEAEGVSVDPSKVCGGSLFARHANLDLSLYGFCLDRRSKVLFFEKGSAVSEKEFRGVTVGRVSLGKGSIDLLRYSGKVEVLTRDPIAMREVTLSLQDHQVSFRAGAIEVNHWRLYERPVTFEDVEFAPVDTGRPLGGDLWVSVRGARLNFNLEAWRLWGDESCQQWLGSVPSELKVGPIPQVKIEGKLKFDLKLKPDVKLSMVNTCKLEGKRPDFLIKLGGKFKYTAYHPDKKPFERETGEGSSDWVPLQLISPNMVIALTTTEDPGFFGHRGFIPAAIENSLRDNLKLGRFFRGGSTLTMQLAKNLWLSRKRTLGRKVQEAILTVALESLPKERILELYLNVVEFGPDIYGIGPACKELMFKDPMSLSIPEALYLVLRLPSPIRSLPYEQKKGLIKRLMDSIAASGKVSAEVIEIEKALLDDPNDDSILL